MCIVNDSYFRHCIYNTVNGRVFCIQCSTEMSLAHPDAHLCLGQFYRQSYRQFSDSSLWALVIPYSASLYPTHSVSLTLLLTYFFSMIPARHIHIAQHCLILSFLMAK